MSGPPPIAPHYAAPCLAGLVNCGLLGRAEALAALLHAMTPANLSPNGRAARLPHGPRETVVIPSGSRAAAARAARDALAPLLLARAGRRSLFGVAKAAGPALPNADIEQLVTEAMQRHLRQTLRIAAVRAPRSRPTLSIKRGL